MNFRRLAILFTTLFLSLSSAHAIWTTTGGSSILSIESNLYATTGTWTAGQTFTSSVTFRATNNAMGFVFDPSGVSGQGAVGIGITPSSKLDVYVNAGSAQRIQMQNGNTAGYAIFTAKTVNSNETADFGVGGSAVGGEYQSFAYLFSNAGLSGLKILTNGGTRAAIFDNSQNLTLSGSLTGTGATLSSTFSVTGVSTLGTLNAGAVTGTSVTVTGTAFGVGTSNFLVSNNQVSIGTPTAAGSFPAALSIAQVSQALGYGAGARIGLFIASTDTFGIDKGGLISLGGMNGSGAAASDPYGFAVLAGRKENASSGNYAGYMQFGTSDGSSNLLEAMRIDSGQHVLVGTTTANSLTSPLIVVGADNGVAGTFKINAVQASLTGSDTLIDFRSNTGSEGSITGSGVAGVLVYNTFTGAHWTQVADIGDSEVEEFLYYPLVSTGEQARFSKNTSPKKQLVATKVCLERGAKGVVGFYAGRDKEKRDSALALGTGFVWVANKGVDVEIGDLLMTSDVLGCTERQESEIVLSISVAKVRSAIHWKAGEKKRLVPCVYICG